MNTIKLISFIAIINLAIMQSEVTQSVTVIESNNLEVGIPDKVKPKNFLDSFLSGFGLIFISEVGDKTFFLTILYATDHSLIETVFLTSLTMCGLNFISLSIGFLIPFFLYRNIIDWIGIIIFTIFGIMMLIEAFSQDKDENLMHDLDELEKELEKEKRDEDIKNKKIDVENNLKESFISKKKSIFTSRWAYISGLIIAEMGDKSQISAIVLGAINNFYGVLLGTSFAFVLCIILSSITGRELASKLTHKQLTILGGVMFLLFAIVYFIQVTGIF